MTKSDSCSWGRSFVLCLAALCVLVACHSTSSGVGSGNDGAGEPPRLELLTLEEALGSQGVVSSKEGTEESTSCGPDWGEYSPKTNSDPVPNTVRFDQGDRWVALGVWDDEDQKNSSRLDDIGRRITANMCRLGRNSPEVGGTGSFDWHVYPVDLGEGIVAFQAVEWANKGIDDPPSVPTSSGDVEVHSTARAYGIVHGKLVMARISHMKPVPPSVDELPVLWEVQVAKVRYYDAVNRSSEVLGPYAGRHESPPSE